MVGPQAAALQTASSHHLPWSCDHERASTKSTHIGPIYYIWQYNYIIYIYYIYQYIYQNGIYIYHWYHTMVLEYHTVVLEYHTKGHSACVSSRLCLYHGTPTRVPVAPECLYFKSFLRYCCICTHVPWYHVVPFGNNHGPGS